jgi:hypothetical protein
VRGDCICKNDLSGSWRVLVDTDVKFLYFKWELYWRLGEHSVMRMCEKDISGSGRVNVRFRYCILFATFSYTSASL